MRRTMIEERFAILKSTTRKPSFLYGDFPWSYTRELEMMCLMQEAHMQKRRTA